MTKCWLLLKIQLLGFFNINRIFHSHDKKEKRRSIALGALMLFVLLAMIGYSIAIAIGFAYIGMADVLPLFILLVCAAITLFFTFLKSIGVLFGFRDYDMIMSMPVKVSTVVFSRLLSVYTVNFLISGIIMLPSLIVFGITCRVSLSVWCMLILSLFLASLLPMIIAMIAGAVITAISVRFRYKNLLIIIFSTAATLAILIGSFSIPQEEGAWTELIASAKQSIYRVYPIAKLYTNALVSNDWGSFAQFALISIGTGIVFVLLLAAYYNKINSALFSVHSKSNYRLGTLKTSTPFMALYKKELHRFVSSPIYVMNTCIGMILLLVMSVALQFINLEHIGNMMGFPDIVTWAKPFAPCIVALFAAISSSTSSSISLEGKYRWIMCSSPVPANVIFKAKISVNLSYLIPSVLISSALLTISLQTDVIETIALFIIPLLFSVFISVIGLAFNLKFPKYDWTTEEQAVKQSLPPLATMGTGFISVLLLFTANFLLSAIPGLALFVEVILIAVVIFAVYRKLGKKKLYE